MNVRRIRRKHNINGEVCRGEVRRGKRGSDRCGRGVKREEEVVKG